MLHLDGKRLLLFGLCFTFALSSGCSEGPLWRASGWTPWVRDKWAKDEKVAATLFARRAQLRKLANRASRMDRAEQERVSNELAVLLNEDSVVLLRIEVVKTLAAFPTETASQALREAAKDADSDVRLAAVQAWQRRGGRRGVEVLQEVLASDTQSDVRLAAARALGSFRDEQAAVRALAIGLDDPDPAMQHVSISSLKSITGRDYGQDVAAWREFARGGNPAPPEGSSVVERLRNLF